MTRMRTSGEEENEDCEKEKLIFFKETFDIPVTVSKWGKLTRLMTCSRCRLLSWAAACVPTYLPRDKSEWTACRR